VVAAIVATVVLAGIGGLVMYAFKGSDDDQRNAGVNKQAPTPSPFSGEFVSVTSTFISDKVPFPGGHNEYLKRPMYKTVTEALKDPVMKQKNARILLLDVDYFAQEVIDASTLPPGIVIESVRTPPTEWAPLANTDPKVPLLQITGGSMVVLRNLRFNGLDRVNQALVWNQPGNGCRVEGVSITGFNATGLALVDPAGGTDDNQIELTRIRVFPADKTPDRGIYIQGTKQPARNVRVADSRLEGPITAGIECSGQVTGLDVTGCRIFKPKQGVRFDGVGPFQAKLVGNTVAQTSDMIHFSAAPPGPKVTTRVELRNNLFFRVVDVVKFQDGLAGKSESVMTGEGNWSGDGSPGAPKSIGSIERQEVNLGLNPGDDDKFLRYDATSALATAGLSRKPVGAPPLPPK